MIPNYFSFKIDLGRLGEPPFYGETRGVSHESSCSRSLISRETKPVVMGWTEVPPPSL